MDTAFESRILIGAVINSEHIEFLSFFLLEDTREIVLEHVQIVMQRHNNIKVNTVFNGEFISDNKRVNKSVNTKNYELLIRPIYKNGTHRTLSSPF